ncbi:MAG: 50S ribosomal protein L11 methyltransferase, partial [Nevskiaceae bacterium]
MVPRVSPRGARNEYTLKGYGDMIADAVRMRAYHAALARSVRPGSVVLDLGSGTGIMALLACKLGARKVYAVEPSEARVVGAELARANGCDDRIEFIPEFSFEVTLPERADVMVSDLRGPLPLHGAHISAVVDARRRLLAPGGIQIPQRDTVRAQLVSDPALHANVLGAWRSDVHGLDLSAAWRWAAHHWQRADVSRSRLIGAPQTLFELDYHSIESPDTRGEVGWTVEAPAQVHAIAAWFDATLVEGVGFSNAPDHPRTIYGQAAFPLEQPLDLAVDDRITVTITATLVQQNYVWQWETRVCDARGSAKAELRQSSFHATPLDVHRLNRRAAGFTPDLTEQGRAAARALALMQQGQPIEAIASQVAAD